jgi:general transcriptional corepressor CYC8
MEDYDRAVICFESVLKNNPSSLQAHYFLGASLHQQQQFIQAMEVYHRLLSMISGVNSPEMNILKGEVWASIGHCALLLDDLARSFSAFQQALQILGSPKDPSIWFAIGLLYDRYGADELAREAFLITLRFEHELKKTNSNVPSDRERELYYRLGLIYKNMKNWSLAHEVMRTL